VSKNFGFWIFAFLGWDKEDPMKAMMLAMSLVTSISFCSVVSAQLTKAVKIRGVK
jgi:hypothetical protein